MLPTIENSDRFKTEFKSFQQRIDAITNENIKKELNDKMLQLLKEVRAIDQQHKDVWRTGQLPSMVTETRSNLTDIRKHINKRLDDWEKSKNIK